jgi:hypothetical protein
MLSIAEISSVWVVALCLSFPELCSSYRATTSSVGKYRLKMSKSISDSKVESLASCKNFKVVEFFSGIGGWAKAFESQKNSTFNVVAAYDVNSVSNEVYKHVYGKNPCSSAIESLSLKTLEALDADIWVRKTLPYCSIIAVFTQRCYLNCLNDITMLIGYESSLSTIYKTAPSHRK